MLTLAHSLWPNTNPDSGAVLSIWSSNDTADYIQFMLSVLEFVSQLWRNIRSCKTKYWMKSLSLKPTECYQLTLLCVKVKGDLHLSHWGLCSEREIYTLLAEGKRTEEMLSVLQVVGLASQTQPTSARNTMDESNPTGFGSYGEHY